MIQKYLDTKSKKKMFLYESFAIKKMANCKFKEVMQSMGIPKKDGLDQNDVW